MLLGVFLAAAVVYFIVPMRHKDENDGNIAYTAMEEAVLPVVYPNMLDREMAPLLGHREDKAVTAERDSLIILPQDRKLSIRLKYAADIVSMRYEIRDMEMENLIERTELTDIGINSDSFETVLPIQNLLEPKTEYLLAIRAGLKDGSEVWYYARILETEHENVGEMLALAEEYSDKTFHYTTAQDLTVYMESSPTADNSSLGVVHLKNSFSQMTWGNLDVEKISDSRITLKELHGNLANVELCYEVAEQVEDGTKEYYVVKENFTMKWASQRIYMMDYERTMNQIFTGSKELYSGKRILIGISDGKDLYAKKSADGRFTAFVNRGELWSFDSAEDENVCVFAFRGSNEASLADIRIRNDRHDIEILNMEDNGSMDFLVYGYMNRGVHEGWTGIAYYHYDAETHMLKEEFFIPASETYEELKEDLTLLAHKGENGIFYLYMDDAVYGIDLTSHEYVVVAHGLNKEKFAVSGNGSRLAWQENTGTYDSGVLYVMNLDNGVRTQIGDGKSSVYRILGFVGNDLVYGIGYSGDYIMSNGRIMGLYLQSIKIVDENMVDAMHYEKKGSYIRDVKVDESRVHITLVKDRADGFYGSVSEDTLVCNVETMPGRMDDIGWYASEEKGRVYFVQLTKDISFSQKIHTVLPKKIVFDKENIITVEKQRTENVIRFYAYGRGRLLGTYTSFADAAEAAYDCMGIVTLGKNDTVWVRGNKSGAYFVRDIRRLEKIMEPNRNDFAGMSEWKENVLLLEATGADLNQILYFVGQNDPVAVYLGEGEIWYLTGYDQTHVRLWNPDNGQSETISFDAAYELFEKNGNDFICCIVR